MARELVHELGHYLAASPARRRLPDYGIPPYGAKGRDVEAWDLDETKAGFVENYLCERLGGKFARDLFRTQRFRRLREFRPEVLAWWEAGGRAGVDEALRRARAPRRGRAVFVRVRHKRRKVRSK